MARNPNEYFVWSLFSGHWSSNTDRKSEETDRRLHGEFNMIGTISYGSYDMSQNNMDQYHMNHMIWIIWYGPKWYEPYDIDHIIWSIYQNDIDHMI